MDNLQWQCPICLKNYSLENLIIDPYFNRITSKVVLPDFYICELDEFLHAKYHLLWWCQMWNCGEDITDIEVKPDGSWRVKTKTEADRRDVGELAQWHYPDGSLCEPIGGDVKTKLEMEKLIKQEGPSDGHNGIGLKLGIRKNCNGFWEVSKPEDANTSSSGSRLLDLSLIHI